MMAKVSTSYNPSTDRRWSARWLAMLQQMGLDVHLEKGRRLARRGRIQDLDVQMGQVTARVEDREAGECAVTIELNRLGDHDWQQVIDTLGSQAFFVAQLLSGDLPGEIEQVFAQAGASLLPGGSFELASRCSCCSAWQQPCAHATAVYYLLGEMLDEDPWLIFRLRGRDRQQILQALRQRRSDTSDLFQPASQALLPLEPASNGSSSAYQTGSFIESAQDTQPLTEQLDDFWGTTKQLEALHHHIAPPPIELALLRRLGPPPFTARSLDTYEQLRDIYRHVSHRALAQAFASDPEHELE